MITVEKQKTRDVLVVDYLFGPAPGSKEHDELVSRLEAEIEADKQEIAARYAKALSDTITPEESK